MSRHPVLGRFCGVALPFAAVLALPPSAPAQALPAQAAATTPQVARPEAALEQALQLHPVTAPYRIAVTYRNGKTVLSGRVGTKQIHDIAVRLAIAGGYRVQDDLVIDTAEAHRVAALGAMQGGGAAPGGVPALGANPYTLGNLPYVYPPPLFGRLDDPFFGFEPPLLSYAPWWRATTYRAPIGAPSQGMGAAPVGTLPPVAEDPAPGAPVSVPLGPSPDDGTIEMTLNARGVAVLRGTVPSLADRIAVGQKIAETPGITEVINLLKVGRTVAAADQPPPPPQPAAAPAARPPGGPQPAPDADAAPPARLLAVDAGPLGPKVTEAFLKRPALADLPIRVTVRDGVASLVGKVPTVYEAMLAFRAVQQIPGVREVVDRLEFAMPDDEHRNPLLQKGRPADVEPYLEAQLRRQLDDLAHVDSVRLNGDTLTVRGSLSREEDRPRLDATLRSMPVLRGFRVSAAFGVD